jgi:outer membrane protein insertion porin family
MAGGRRALILGAVVLLAAAGRGLAQDGPEPVLARVTVTVDGHLAPRPIADLVPFKPGDPYSAAAIDRVVKQVFETGLFADVRVTRGGEEKIDLGFELVRNLVIRKIRFQGVKVRASRLMETMESLRPGTVFTEERLPKAVDELKEGLKREGYFGAGVEPSTRRIPDAPQVDVTFKISGWKRYNIGSIEVQGVPVVPPGQLFMRMKTRKGGLYVPSRLDKDIQALQAYYTSLDYRRADLQLAPETFDDARGTVALVLEVQPHEKITIVVNGARVPSSLLAPIWEERIFEEWGLAEGEARVLNYMRKKGYVYAVVTSRIERPENEIRVIHDVATGKKYSIKSISFEGLKSFSPQKLKTELLVSERTLFFSLLSYDRLFALPQEIEYFYRTHGFPEARAELELPRIEGGVKAILKIDEGPRQILQSIVLSGTRLFPPEEILKELVEAQGGPYFPPSVRRDLGVIENFYLNHGIRGTTVTSRVESAGPNLFTLTFEIEEGTPVAIQNILVTGNRTTRDSVVNKEIQVRKGGPADQSLIVESKRRLERLGIFSEVRTQEILTEPGKENLVVTVQEGEVNYAGVGLGFESTNAVPSGEPMDFRPRITGEYIRSNVFGRAAQLGLIGQFSDIEERAVISWNQPYLFGAALRPSVLAWVEKEDRTSFTYDRRGVGLNITRPVTPQLTLFGTLRWSRTDLSNLQIPESEIDRRLQHYSTTSASVSAALDRRDDTFNPAKGYFVSVLTELAKPLFGTESDYWKNFFKFQYLRTLAPEVVLSLLGRVGLVTGEISLPERFFAGGSYSFRGEYFDFLGPKDPETGEPLGGRALFLVNAEARFPIIPALKALSGAAFFDYGNVFTYISDFRFQDLEAAVGGGLRYRTPLGPIRFDIAWNVYTPPPQTRKKTAYLFITIGHMF